MNIEETKEAIRVMQAYVDGKEVEDFSPCQKWKRVTTPRWGWDDTQYRIKPTATLRPWTADEVPLGAQMRRKTDRHRFLIGSVANDGSRNEWLEHNEHSIDGGKTWHPCGVMEEAWGIYMKFKEPKL
jgi:hypothetical protein